MIEAEFSGIELGQDITIEDIVDASMPVEEILDELDLETEDGEAAMESIVDKAREIVAAAEGDEPVEEEVVEEEEIADEVADEADDESVETDEATIEVADEEDI